MVANFDVQPDADIYIVNQRKYNLDPSRPWWQKAYFRRIFMPFLRWSVKRMGVLMPSAIDKDGNAILIEQQGVYWDEAVANDACENEFWCVKPLPLNVALPRDSCQYKGHKYPRSIMPDRYRRRTYPVSLVKSKEIELAEKVNQGLDRLLEMTDSS